MTDRARFRPPLCVREVQVKSLDPVRMTATSVLTFPVVDWDGDWVQPDGGDWDRRFKSRPAVNWGHEFPCGRGSVELKSLEHDGKPWDVPVGTTSFFRSEADCRGLDLTAHDPATFAPVGQLTPKDACAVAEDAFRLVEAGIATGVSLEFDPDPAHTFDTGRKSLTRRRPARRYDRWTALGWSHVPEPANPGAQVLPDSVGKALVLAQTGRWSGGQPLSAPVLKSLTRWAAALPARKQAVQVPRTVRKAMDDQTPPDVTADVPLDATAPPDAATSDTPPEAQVSYDGAQMLADMAQRLRDAAAKTLDDKTYKALTKCAENLEAEAEDLTAIGEGVEAKIAGRSESESPAEDTTETPGSDAPDTSDGDKTDDDEPEVKALPRKLERRPDGSIVLKSAYTPRRLTLADLGEPQRKTKTKSRADLDDEHRRARLEIELRRLKREIR